MDTAISGAEWQVMRVLWANPGATSTDVVQALEAGFDWQPVTIKTLLGRLRKKGYLKMEKIEKKYRYWPCVNEEHHLHAQLTILLENSCSTKNADLVFQLLKQGSFSRKDLEKIAREVEVLLPKAPETIPCHCLPGQCTCH
ncbi:BlaI/MecI/CopY family transcriptional regulator [Streptococcus cameli]